MSEAVIHIRDDEHRYNGSDGDWTVCGHPWPAEGQEAIWPDAGICEACMAERPLPRIREAS